MNKMKELVKEATKMKMTKVMKMKNSLLCYLDGILVF